MHSHLLAIGKQVPLMMTYVCRYPSDVSTFADFHLQVFDIYQSGQKPSQTLTSLLPGFVDSLQMVSLPKRSRLKSFSSQRFLDCFGLYFGECLCIHCSTGPFLLVRMGREYRVSVTKRLYSYSITRNH